MSTGRIAAELVLPDGTRWKIDTVTICQQSVLDGLPGRPQGPAVMTVTGQPMEPKP